MSYAYEQKKRGTAPAPALPGKTGAAERNIPNSMRLAALERGQASPTAADKGHRVDLPEAMRAKMESSFGMDFSKVKLYESRMLGETGAEAMAQGNEIAFAPGKFDVSSAEGQARLGHELSHVASQARGEVRGTGFLQDSALEARADREGALAARGESAYGGAAAPLSSASPVAMAGPMQAKKNKDKIKPLSKEEQAKQNVDELFRMQAAMMDSSVEDPEEKNDILNQEELNRFQDLLKNADVDTVVEVQRRGFQASENLVKHRDSLEGDDIDKKNYEASFSDAGMENDIYGSLANKLINSKGAKEFYRNRKQYNFTNNKTKEEADRIKLQAEKIKDANFEMGGGRAKYLTNLLATDEGKQAHEKRKADLMQRYRDIAMGKNGKG